VFVRDTQLVYPIYGKSIILLSRLKEAQHNENQ